MAQCENCGNEKAPGEDPCRQCGVGIRVGPATEEMETAPVEEEAPLETYILDCPKCREKTFNGWNCRNPECRHAIPEKARRAHGRVATDAEVAKALGMTLDEFRKWSEVKARPVGQE